MSSKKTPSGYSGDKLSRRQLMKLSAAGTVAAAVPATAMLAPRQAQAIESNAHIVIVGAGAAGVSMASRLSRAINNPRITIIDAREAHYYQPGLTLLAVGAWRDAGKVIDRNDRYLPGSTNWIKDTVASFDPDNNRVFTQGGQQVGYDYLMVSPGLDIRYDLIEGMSPDLIGQNGIGCVYDNPEHGMGTARMIDELVENGGKALMTRPHTDIKCAGAPLKVTLLTDHRMRDEGVRNRTEMHYLSGQSNLFSQPDIDQFLYKHMPNRNIPVRNNHELVGIEPGQKIATFSTPDGLHKEDYDFIHVVPPMTAPEPVRNGPLAWQEGRFQGWLEVDKLTLQHRRYPNVFGVGDVIGTPVGKTAASVKAQVPVAVENLLATIQNKDLPRSYDGYTSCPLITEKGKAILVEFDYELKMTPSFNFINPYEEHWVPWILKEKMLQAAYLAMLRGRV